MVEDDTFIRTFPDATLVKTKHATYRSSPTADATSPRLNFCDTCSPSPLHNISSPSRTYRHIVPLSNISRASSSWHPRQDWFGNYFFYRNLCGSEIRTTNESTIVAETHEQLVNICGHELPPLSNEWLRDCSLWPSPRSKAHLFYLPLLRPAESQILARMAQCFTQHDLPSHLTAQGASTCTLQINSTILTGQYTPTRTTVQNTDSLFRFFFLWLS